MIRTYLLLAIRHFRKRKLYSFINISGLSIGIAVCLVIWKYVEFESSYDNFHRNGDNIYRTTFTEYGENWKGYWVAEFGYGLGPAIINEIPEIANFARIHPLYGEACLMSVVHDGQQSQFYEENVFFADSSFLDIFTYDVLKGNASEALDNPSSIVITESKAKQYFGHTEPIGKSLTVRNNYWGHGEYIITAVVKDVPENSHLQFDFLLSIHNLLQIDYYKDPNSSWSANNFITYVQMSAKTDPKQLEEKTKRFMDLHSGTEPLGVRLAYQPLRAINFTPDLNNPNGHFNTLYFFLLISFFILSIAWINYINLSTAKATERAKEVGIKKTMGVLRSQLVTQFTIEALAINVISVLFALGIAAALLPVLNGIIGKNIEFNFSQPRLWIVLSLLFGFGTVVSGVYPAMTLSSFNPVDVIKGITKYGRGLVLRKALVVFQFTASLLLIAGTFIIFRQVNFMVNREKGFNMYQMLIVNGPQFMEGVINDQRLISFKTELLKISSIGNVTSSGAIPGGGYSFTTGMQIKSREDPNTIRETIHVVMVDTDFIHTYGMKMMSGKLWDSSGVSELKSVFINETTLDRFDLGTPEQALDKILIIDGELFAVQGVIKNLHWNSPKSGYVPMVFRPQLADATLFSIRLTSNIQQSVMKVEEVYKKMFPGNPFRYYFLDDFFNMQYRDEQQAAKLFTMFSALAIVIACLGLWGLASFTTAQRIKEISIRKVLGASSRSIVRLLTTEFLRLLIFSSIIAMPGIWYGANSWFDNFAFRIGMTVDVFIIPIVVVTAIALMTISIQILKGASGNPAQTLRSE